MIQYFTFGSFLLLLVVSGTYSNLLIRIILKIKIIKSVKECLLHAPWCMSGSIHRSLDTDCQLRLDQNVNNPKQPGDKANKNSKSGLPTLHQCRIGFECIFNGF